MIAFDPPQGLLNSMLLIPYQAGYCSSPIGEIERITLKQQIDEELCRKNVIYKDVCQLLEIEFISGVQFYTRADLKVQWVRRDIMSLGDNIAEIYIAKLESLQFTDFSSDKLYQIVEIPWTLKDMYAGEEKIHYKIFTKREIFVKA